MKSHHSKEADEGRLRAAHWRNARILMFSLIGAAIILAIGTTSFVNQLNEAAIFGFPLGYFIMVNGIPLILITALFWGTIRQENEDLSSNINEDR